MRTLIKNANIINEGKIFSGGLIIENDTIFDIFEGGINEYNSMHFDNIINAENNYLIPGVIDVHVHFREPGLTHKADIETESIAAVAGGVTSFMDMPNTFPPTTTLELLEQKFETAERKSVANYSFYLGATNDNIDQILKLSPEKICGVKVFMGSSTGNMLVDDNSILNRIFSESPILISTHCEDENIIRENLEYYKSKYPNGIPFDKHPDIRSVEACLKSTSKAIDLALKYNTRLHVAHLSTLEETKLFDNNKILKDKRITAEVCVQYLWFDNRDYYHLGPFLKSNPAIKSMRNKNALLKALLENRIDLIATDHAPHTIEEKNNTYLKSPSGIPMIQHSLLAMLEFYHRRQISLPVIVDKMCHSPAICFSIKKRGFIKKGYKADLSIIDLNNSWTVEPDNILSKCKWSPFSGFTFQSKVIHTFVNGNHVYNNGVVDITKKGERLYFLR
ncbi:MAG: dihydroorotase [Bacteroidota bacterium]|nr:dihydroorotase [Bacteroidota bacterium]